MKRLILFSLLVWVLCADPMDAQDLPGISTSRQFRTERLSENHLRLTGQVEIDGGTWRFHADQVDIFIDESRLEATGNVVFSEEGGRVAAERVEFDIEAVTGAFYNASGSTQLVEDVEPSMFGTQEPEMRFWGEVIEKTGPRTYRLTEGGFTSCVQPTPRWEVSASSVTINLDEYAVMRNSLLSVKGVPLFYLPVLYYPIQADDRATGILMPTYGTSTIRGQSLSNAFFWAINRSHDATVFHDWFTSTGKGLGAEYRYIAGSASRGNVETYFLDETESALIDPFTGLETTLPARRSYQLRGNVQHSISDSINARGQIDYFSDVSVQQTFTTDIFRATNSSRSYGGNVTGSWNAYTLSGTADVAETFFGQSDSSLYGASPRLSFTQSEQQLFGSPIYYGLSSEYGNLLQSSTFGDMTFDSGLTRLDVNPLIRIPLTRWPFLTFNSTVGFRHTRWAESLDPVTFEQISRPVSRSMMDFETEITGPVFVKVWDTPNTTYSERMKHVIEPWVSIRRTTAVENFDEIVQIDYTDSIVGNVTQFRYGLNNRLYARRAEGGGPPTAQEILTVSVEQSYYTDSNAAQYDNQFLSSFRFDAASNFSPMAISARTQLTSELAGTLRAEYDTDFLALRTIGADATVEVGGWLNQRAGWSQRRFIEGLPGHDDPFFLDHTLNSFTNLRTPGNKVGGVYEFNYDVQLGRLLQQRILAYYNAQCCGFSVEYQEYNLEGLGFLVRAPQDRRFNISFTLAGLSTFSNMLGAFGVGTGSGQY
ncbi:MAG: putative LPS assembly protein LptD [Acidobacteriota bacterium]|nr:putative LPS assembly protein LptD [Acidobacteriota bacterium]